ncbi:MAG: tRNA uridine(34) 5-carboxymethylaminomethyl modification radical SAM/GNAT enzyme Elp3, partial [Candidatus Bathyarchaeia archaeon]
MCREIIEYLMRIPNPTIRDVNVAKTRIAEKYGLSIIPSNSDIIKCLKAEERAKLLKILRRKAIRT